MLPVSRTCRYLPRRHGWTSPRTSSPCWPLGGGTPLWCSGSPWLRSFTWGRHLERYSNPPRCLPSDASHALRSPVPGASDAWGGFGFRGLAPGRAAPLWSKPGLNPQGAWDAYHANSATFDLLGWRWFGARWTEKRSRQLTCRGSSTSWPITRMGFPGAIWWPSFGSGRPGGSRPALDVRRLGKPSSSKPERLFGTFSERPRLRCPSSLPTASCVVVPPGLCVRPVIDRCVTTAESGHSNARYAWTALAAMAFDGRYVAEAAGAMPGWDPERANARVEEQRARQLRDHFGLQRDDDLAYAFESFEDAVRAGGQALAVQWLEARASAEQSLLRDAANTVEAGQGSSSDRRPPLSRQPALHRAKGVTLTGGAFEPGNVVRRAEALKDTFMEMGVMRPHTVSFGHLHGGPCPRAV